MKEFKGKTLKLTASIDAASVGSDGGNENYSSPVLGFHAFDYSFDQEEGGAEVYCYGVVEF